MSKISKLKKDKLIRGTFLKKEMKILIYKYSILNTINIDSKRYYWWKFLNKFHLNWSKARIVNQCFLTGRTRWVIRRYRLSRIMFKELCDHGKIHGVRRASW